MREALLRGDGLAVAACGALLRRAGWRVGSAGPVRPKLPVVLLNQASQKLLMELFERRDLLEGWYPIEKRIVRWSGEMRAMPHAALAVDEGKLFERLGMERGEGTGGYVVYGGKPLPEGVSEASFGERVTSIARVKLAERGARACWVEAVEDGWLFTTASDAERGWLLSVGASVEELLRQSVLMREVVGGVEEVVGGFASQPRIASALCGEGWIACGGAAMSFDPICGEGTGHALREAILGCAVLKAHERGEDWGELGRLYTERLRGGFARHLELCRLLYAKGGEGAWWKQQLTALGEFQAPVTESRYRLVDFDLVRVA